MRQIVHNVRWLRKGARAWLSIAWLIALAGCLNGRHNEIESVEAQDRINAIQAAARQKNADAIPPLVDRLEDDDEAVRFYAILALERIVGERKGYLYYRRPELQPQAIERWRAYAKDRTTASRGDTASRPTKT